MMKNPKQPGLFRPPKQPHAAVAKTVKAGTTGGSVRQGVRLPSAAPNNNNGLKVVINNNPGQPLTYCPPKKTAQEMPEKPGFDWSENKQKYLKHKCSNNSCDRGCTGLKKDGTARKDWCKTADCCYFCCHALLKPGLNFCPCNSHICWATFANHTNENKGCLLSYTYDLIKMIFSGANPEVLDALTRNKKRKSNVLFANHLSGVMKAVTEPYFNDPIKKRISQKEWKESIKAGN